MTTIVLSDYYRDLALQEVLSENRPRLLKVARQIASITKRLDLSEIPASTGREKDK
jgi:hypothetical protein